MLLWRLSFRLREHGLDFQRRAPRYSSRVSSPNAGVRLRFRFFILKSCGLCVERSFGGGNLWLDKPGAFAVRWSGLVEAGTNESIKVGSEKEGGVLKYTAATFRALHPALYTSEETCESFCLAQEASNTITFCITVSSLVAIAIVLYCKIWHRQ